MNPKLFISFDFNTGMRTTHFDPSTSAAVATSPYLGDIILPSGVLPYTYKYYGAGGFLPSVRNLTSSYMNGRTSGSYAWGGTGAISSLTNFFLLGVGGLTSRGGAGLYFNKSGYGITDDVYYSCDFMNPPSNSNADNFLSLAFNDMGYFSNGNYVGATGNQIFQFGNCSIRYLGYSGFNGTSANYTFGLFNNERYVGRVDSLGVNSRSFHFIKARIYLNSTTGIIDLIVNGAQTTYTGNTLSGISLGHSAAQEVHFAPSCSPNTVTHSLIDNCYFSTEGFPVGRPKAERVNITGDRNNNGWLALNSHSLATGVSVSGSGYISGALGASVELIAAPVTFNTGDKYLGFEIGFLGINNNDIISGRRLSVNPVISDAVLAPFESGTPLPLAQFNAQFSRQFLFNNSNQLGTTGINNTAIKLNVI